MGLFNFDSDTGELNKMDGMRAKGGISLLLCILWNEFWNLIKLNLMFILFCIPVVTVPAAITAMNRIHIYMIRDEHRFLWHDFVRVFKREFVSSLPWGLLFVAVICASAFGVWYYFAAAQRDTGMIFAVIVCLLVLMAACTAASYFFPMLSFVNLKPSQQFRNAFLLTFIRFPVNLLTFAVCAAIIILEPIQWDVEQSVT